MRKNKEDVEILIIDDEHILADVLMRHFRKEGYVKAHFVTAESDVFGYIRENGYPDVFITDFLIDGATHGNCIHMVETLQTEIPLIIGVTSFFDDMEVRTMLYEAGACDVEGKTDFKHVVSIIDYLLKIEEDIDQRGLERND